MKPARGSGLQELVGTATGEVCCEAPGNYLAKRYEETRGPQAEPETRQLARALQVWQV